MNVNGIISLVLVAIGVGLIILGAVMTLKDWKRQHDAEITAKADSLDKTLTAFAKVLDALKGYPPGQQLIGFGILLLLVAGVWGGFSAL